MAQFTITFSGPAGVLSDGVSVLASAKGWQETVTDENGNIIPNPVTKEVFVEAAIKAMVRSEIIRHERAQLAAQAKQQAAQAAHDKYSSVT